MGKVYRTDREKYVTTAKEWTRKYAMLSVQYCRARRGAATFCIAQRDFAPQSLSDTTLGSGVRRAL